MTTDLDRRLADLRLTPHWPTDEQAATLTHILDSDPVPHRADLRALTGSHRGRRVAVLVGAAGLAAAACVAVPAVLPDGSPGSADQAAATAALRHLARVAAVSPADQLRPGQFLHLVDVDHQAGSPGQAADSSRYESWIRPDGQTWQRRTEQSPSGRVHREVWLLPAGPQVIDGMTAPQVLNRLPTRAAELESYVRAHTSGSTSVDERVFVAVVDIVRRGLAGPGLRSAALEVLARLGHVRLGDATRDSLGNPVQAFEFVDPRERPDDVRTIMFDTRTAQITQEYEYFHGRRFFTRTVPVLEVVDSVPASVRAHAVPQK